MPHTSPTDKEPRLENSAHDVAPVDLGSVQVAIVATDLAFARRVASVLERYAGIVTIWVGQTLAVGFKLMDQQPDLLIVDADLADGDGVQLLEAAAAHRHAKTIVLAESVDAARVITAVRAGAGGYLLKSAGNDEIVAALYTVLEGGAAISPVVAAGLFDAVRSEPLAVATESEVSEVKAEHDTSAHLTERERNILESLATGRSFKEVAAKENISVHTVGDHVKSIYRKLSVNSRGEAVFKAIRAGLISFD